MKHWVWYLAALILVAILCGMPFERTDVAQLQPVQVVQVSHDGGQVVVQTDTGDIGTGATLYAAFEDLKQTTPGYVFLETAEYLLLTEDARALIPELTEYLRPGCGVCVVMGEADLQAVAQYLSAHPLQVTLRICRADQAHLPCLIVHKDGRLTLAGS